MPGSLTYLVSVGLSMAVPRTLKSSILKPGAPEPVPLMTMLISVKYSLAPRCGVRSKVCHPSASALSHPWSRQAVVPTRQENVTTVVHGFVCPLNTLEVVVSLNRTFCNVRLALLPPSYTAVKLVSYNDLTGDVGHKKKSSVIVEQLRTTNVCECMCMLRTARFVSKNHQEPQAGNVDQPLP